MGLVVIPVALALFFITILSPGLPLKVPAGIVDMDNTPMSREISRNLSATELVDFTRSYNSFNEAMAGVQRGEVMGFFIIPDHFERDAVSGRGRPCRSTPTLHSTCPARWCSRDSRPCR